MMIRVQDEFKLLLVCISVLCVCPAHAAKVNGQISKVGDATHLEFSGRKNWVYNAEKLDGGKLRIQLPAFDEITEAKLKSWSGSFVKSVKIDRNGPDRTYVVDFQLANKDVEFFDYLTDDPSRLIIDFYQQAKVRTPEPKSKEKTTPLPEKKSPPKMAGTKELKLNNSNYKKVSRKPAATELIQVNKPTEQQVRFESLKKGLPERGIFDGGDSDYSRFSLKDYQIKEESIIASQQNIYLKFPMLKMSVGRFKKMIQDPPEFEIVNDESPEIKKENAEALFLLQLYQKKRFGAFAKTYDYFIKKYPNSKYEEIVRNLNAEMHILLYDRDKNRVDYETFRSEYKYLIETFPDSVLVPRQRLLLGYAALEAKDGAAALQEFAKYQKIYPDNVFKEHIDLAMAEAYIMLNKPDSAVAIYKELERDAEDKNIAVESSYRIGDVFFIHKKYRLAAKSYERVIKAYPEHAKILPNAHYNLSESYFWLGKYKKSLNQYVTFVKTFPSHEHGGYALTRVGELLQILGADQAQFMGAFLESYFRYPKSNGAAISKIRMLSQQLRGMKEKEVKIALREMDELSKTTDLPRMDEFVTLMIADGQNLRGEYRKALDRLLVYFQSHPTTANFKVISARILRNIADVLKTEVEQGNFYEALKVNGQFAKTWLKRADRIDTQYFKGRSYELAGVHKEAEKTYKDIIARMSKSSWKKEFRRRKVYEHLPSIDQLRLRLANVQKEQRKYPEAMTNLKLIGKGLADEEQVEQVQIGAQVAQKMNKPKTAINYLKQFVDTYEGEPELLSGPYIQLADLYIQTKNLNKADSALSYVEQLKETNMKVSDDHWAETLKLRASYNMNAGQKLAAVETYLKLLNEFENKKPMQSIRYKAGLVLFDEGDVKGAEKIWAGLDKDSGGFYLKLAEEKMNHSNWKSAYTKYLDRIPAATDMK